MLAKFDNGYFLEVREELHPDPENEGESLYVYEIYDEDLNYVETHWTEYRNIELYYPMNEIDYILKFCEPDDVKGEYELLKQNTMEEYLEFNGVM